MERNSMIEALVMISLLAENLAKQLIVEEEIEKQSTIAAKVVCRKKKSCMLPAVTHLKFLILMKIFFNLKFSRLSFLHRISWSSFSTTAQRKRWNGRIVHARKAGQMKSVNRLVGFQKRGDGTNARSNQNPCKAAPCDLCPLGKHR